MDYFGSWYLTQLNNFTLTLTGNYAVKYRQSYQLDTDLQSANETLANLSNQKISALLKKLVDSNKVAKTIDSSLVESLGGLGSTEIKVSANINEFIAFVKKGSDVIECF